MVKWITIVTGTRKFYIDGEFLVIFTQTGVLCGNISYGGVVEQLINLYDKLIDLNRFGVPQNAEKVYKQLDIFAKIAFIYSQSMICMAVASPILDYSRCLKRKNNEYSICGATNTWAPFDITVFPYRHFIYFLTGFSYLILYSAILSITFFAGICTRYLILRLEYTKFLFHKAKDETNHLKRKQIIYEAIEYHCRILE